MDICESLRQHRDIVELFAAEKLNNGFLAVGAPMVRYSKLEFRKLIRQHAVKLCFTPMIIADSFNKSEAARQNEFTTCQGDQALIAQFAAKSIDEFITAAQLIYPYVDGVDVNCGCDLLKNPQMIYDIVRTIRRTLPQDFSCSFKIRLLTEDVRTTVELARQLEHCGATFISIHGRTQWQKCSHPLNVSALAEIKKSVSIPIIVNGDVRSRVDACKLLRETLADGVMAARGLLANPALFDSKFESEQGTPIQCVQNWLDIAAESGNRITFQCFHHHLTFMWGKQMKRPMRLKFNNYTLKEEVFDFFDEYYGLRPQANLNMSVRNTSCTYTHLKPQEMSNYLNDITNQEWRPENNGDQALIAQFAAKSIDEFITAAQLIYPYVDGVDVNCGCPQSWAIAKGYGCDLLKNPQMMYDIVRTIRRTLPQDFSCSFKIRLLTEDVRTTVELARQLEHCGATFISIHGRTQWQKCSHPLNVSALAEIKKSVSIPIIVNGDVRSRFDACKLLRETLADGVMAARGLLANPALFDSKFESEQGTPIQCVQNWLDIEAESGNRITFQCFHHHLTFMWGKQMKRPMRLKFNNYTLKEEVFDFFDEYYGLRPQANLNMSVRNTSCTYTHLKPQEMSNYLNDITNQEWRPENNGDQALIAQFAAKSIDEFITAAQLIYPYVDGVDVNCGCPQSWAIAKGYGCDLLKNPQMMYDIVRTIRRTLPQDFSCSFKIRLLTEDVRTTVELARQLEHCGATFISIHGRTQWQKCSHPLNVSALAEIKKSVSIPIIVNGDVRSRVDACKLLRETLADGVMAARGLLANPALFDSKFESEQGTPIQCVQNWLDIAAESGNRITFQCFHHHLTFMWGKQMKRPMRLKFNNYTLKEEVFDFFDEYYGLRPQANLNMSVRNTSCTYTHLKPQEMSNYLNDITNQEWRPENNGKYFLDFNKEAISHSNEINLQDCYFLNS